MASKLQRLVFLFFFFLLLSFCSSSQLLSLPDAASQNTTAYEILSKHGLPSGLLPDSVTNYTLSEDGSFEITLKKPCYLKFDYLVYYGKKITGKLSIGSIRDLKGIEVQRFFFWFDVDEIRVDLPASDSIYFTVGIVNKKLHVHQFLTLRSCEEKIPVPVNDIPMLLTE